MATGACAPATCAKPMTLQQYASVVIGIFILQSPARSLADPDVFFSLSHEAGDKTCRRPIFGQLTLVGDGPQGKPNQAAFAAHPLKGPFMRGGPGVFPSLTGSREPRPQPVSGSGAVEKARLVCRDFGRSPELRRGSNRSLQASALVLMWASEPCLCRPRAGSCEDVHALGSKDAASASPHGRTSRGEPCRAAERRGREAI